MRRDEGPNGAGLPGELMGLDITMNREGSSGKLPHQSVIAHGNSLVCAPHTRGRLVEIGLKLR